MHGVERYPTDDDFLSAFVSRDIYHTKLCRYILNKLESHDGTPIIDLLNPNLTIEHIIPQNPQLNRAWQEMLGADWAAIQSKYLHTIGNLTIVVDNPLLGDKSFVDKRDDEVYGYKLAKNINSYLLKQDAWGETQALERAQQLAKIAKQIWIYPNIAQADIEKYRKKSNYYTIDSYKFSPHTRELFDIFDSRVMGLDNTSVYRVFNKLYISYKYDTSFVDVVIQKGGLRLAINMKFFDVVDPKGICKDITNIGRWGTGDVEVKLNNRDELDDVMAIVEQSYRNQESE
ncbi:MAG: DUF1524 domain-containing protein [Clostridiales bacterium]|nr:DUF1524 domain-containing protein [Clostridiales bacterium]